MLRRRIILSSSKYLQVNIFIFIISVEILEYLPHYWSKSSAIYQVFVAGLILVHYALNIHAPPYQTMEYRIDIKDLFIMTRPHFFLVICKVESYIESFCFMFLTLRDKNKFIHLRHTMGEGA